MIVYALMLACSDDILKGCGRDAIGRAVQKIRTLAGAISHRSYLCSIFHGAPAPPFHETSWVQDCREGLR